MGEPWLATKRGSQVNAVTWGAGSSDWTRTSNPASQRRASGWLSATSRAQR